MVGRRRSPEVRVVNLRIPADELEALREEARKAHRSLHAQILWILSRRYELARVDAYQRARALAGQIPVEEVRETLDPWEELRQLGGQVEIEDVSEELRRIDRPA